MAATIFNEILYTKINEVNSFPKNSKDRLLMPLKKNLLILQVENLSGSLNQYKDYTLGHVFLSIKTSLFYFN